uniref:Glycosyltransferase family 2 protein n=1 Tax=Candidatus Desulfatibia profunda TaxID=2841695 RepID=A0A8J6NQP5_9BACT|nr:glycosyltransferase family 2 protein [Candidatus Desulfatibia profunda]
MDLSPLVINSQGKNSNPSNKHDVSNMVAVVVTHNRKNLLSKCIDAILNQTALCDIVVLDNASTDGTKEFFNDGDFIGDRRSFVHYLRLKENIGGAGGFHFGLKYAMLQRWEWFWLMDDDAVPEPDALENLLSRAEHEKTIYGSVAIGMESGKKRLCWPAEIRGRKKEQFIEYYDLLNDLNEVEGIPFLGFFIHRSIVRKIGLPNPDFFIYGDDKEYCERAKKNGVKLIIVKNSVIYHPLPDDDITFRFMHIKIIYRSLPSWKIYYNVRNKIFIGKKYYGRRLWLQTIPGILFRAFVSLIKEKKGLSLLHVYMIAFIDGFSDLPEKTFCDIRKMDNRSR